ncbi:MAG: hypothetical protein IID36_05705 [Planctomycetes bacterium]|nr:hypothetical protein [Planctomycetota bacterium]
MHEKETDRYIIASPLLSVTPPATDAGCECRAPARGPILQLRGLLVGAAALILEHEADKA